MKPTMGIPAEESSRPRELQVQGPRAENKETQSGVAEVWRPRQRVACDKVTKIGSIRRAEPCKLESELIISCVVRKLGRALNREVMRCNACFPRITLAIVWRM